MRQLISLVFCGFIASNATAGADRVIPPYVDARLDVAANSVSLGTIIDRNGARELARVLVEPFTVQEKSGMIVEGADNTVPAGQLAEASRAIGYFRLMKNGKAYQCTGSLLNDAANSGTPYFLTARHCVSTKEEAASVEVTWDQKFEACGSNRISSGLGASARRFSSPRAQPTSRY